MSTIRSIALRRQSLCALFSTDSLSHGGSGIGYSRSTQISSSTYTYDAMGNRTDHSGSSGAGNRLSSFDGLAISYDADGNVSEKLRSGISDRNYYWSAESQLDSVIDSENSGVKYEYNALGKPVIKSRKSLGGSWSVDSYYVWDGDQLLIELDGSGNRRADYMYYPGTIDTPAAEELGATDITQFRDHQIDGEGNVTGIVYAGTVSQQVSYDAWGTPTVSGNSDNRILWKGLMWEGDLVSLYYMRNRWYDPEVGRFASEDPIGHAGGENLYTFANNDPVNASDPSGMNQLATIEVWANYYPELPKWGAAAEASLLSAFFAGGGGGGGGAPLGRVEAFAPQLPKSRSFAACVAAATDLGLAAATDLVSLTGFGLVATRGTRGAALGIKLLRGSEWLLEERLANAGLLATRGGLKGIQQWSTRLLVGAAWTGTSNALQGDSLSIWKELGSLVPGINTGLKLLPAIKACFQ